jgi:hypothetical protein
MDMATARGGRFSVLGSCHDSTPKAHHEEENDAEPKRSAQRRDQS